MFIDDKGKLFGKVSIIDALIVLILIGLVAGFVFKTAKSKTIMEKTSTMQIQFFSEEAPEYVGTTIPIGASVRDAERGTVFGTVKDKKIDGAVSFGSAQSGEIVKSSKPNYSSILLTVNGNGILNENGLTIGGFEYNVGRTVTLKVGTTIFIARIYSMND